jgi:hypothetical protein
MMNSLESQTLNLYHQDFQLWLEETVANIKDKEFDRVEWQYVIEEIEALGKSEKRELRNRMIVLMEHLLKLLYWKDALEQNRRGWISTIKEQRRQLLFLIKDSPSLKLFMKEIFDECYADAVDDVMDKTNLPREIFKDTRPIFQLDDILQPEFFSNFSIEIKKHL